MTVNNLSWENVEALIDNSSDDEQYHQLCQSSKPTDFYFTTVNENDGVSVYLTPAVYFDETGAMWDQSMAIDHLLPAYLADNEIMEGVWFADERTGSEITHDLLSLGFLTNDQFTLMIKEVAAAYEAECEYVGEEDEEFHMISHGDELLDIENDDSEYDNE